MAEIETHNENHGFDAAVKRWLEGRGFKGPFNNLKIDDYPRWCGEGTCEFDMVTVRWDGGVHEVDCKFLTFLKEILSV